MKRIKLAVVVSVLLLSLAGCTNPALDEDTDIVNTESVLQEQNVVESDEVSEMETTQPAEKEEVAYRSPLRCTYLDRNSKVRSGGTCLPA